MLVHRGTLRVGDAIVAGDASGKVRALYDYKGEKVKEARPGEPVEILGFDRPPPAGELARVVEHERQAKDLAQKRAERLRREQLAQRSKRGVSLESLFSPAAGGRRPGSQHRPQGRRAGLRRGAARRARQDPALRGARQRHPHGRRRDHRERRQPRVGLERARDRLQRAAERRGARRSREREGVDIRTYRVIYQLTDEIQQALVGMLSPVQTEETLGEAEVRALFKVSRLGTIAGCMVTSGVIRRNAQVRVVRDGTVIYDTSIAQLKRFKDDAREVAEGFECGILLEGYNDLKEGDILEAYETRQIERTDLDEAAPRAGIGRRAGRRRRIGAGPGSPPSVTRDSTRRLWDRQAAVAVAPGRLRRRRVRCITRHGGARCRERGRRQGLDPNVWVQALHELEPLRRYSTVVVCGVFGLGSSREQDREALRRLHEAVEPGGTLLLDNEVPYANSRRWPSWTRRGPHRVARIVASGR